MEDELPHFGIHVPKVELILAAVSNIAPDCSHGQLTLEERALRGEVALNSTCWGADADRAVRCHIARPVSVKAGEVHATLEDRIHELRSQFLPA